MGQNSPLNSRIKSAGFAKLTTWIGSGGTQLKFRFSENVQCHYDIRAEV